MSHRPTLRDVAADAGVSHITVSRVVRGEKTVRPATLEHVRKSISKLGYRPDPRLSALAAYRTTRSGGSNKGSVLAFLDCDGDAFSALVLGGARREAASFGYTVEPFALSLDKEPQRRLSSILFHRGIEGLLVGPSFLPRRFERWNWERFAAVSLGALFHEPELHSVAMNYFHALRLAWEKMKARGCRRIGLVVARDLEARTGHLWLGAYLATAGTGIPPLLVSGKKPEPRDLGRWIRQHRVGGVLTVHPDLHGAITAHGIPVCYLNDLNRVPGADCIAFDPAAVGEEGVRLLHHLLLRREFGLPANPKMVLLRGRWNAGLDSAESPVCGVEANICSQCTEDD